MAPSLVMHRRLQEKKSQHLFSRMVPKRGQGASSTRFPGVVPTKPARVLGLFLSGLPCTLPFSTPSSSFVANQAGVQVRPKKILRHANSQPSLDPVVVQTLSSSLNMHNSWIKSYKSVLLEIDNSRGTTENVGIEFAQVSRQTHGPVVGDAPPTSGK